MQQPMGDDLVLDEHAKTDRPLEHADAQHYPTPGVETTGDVVRAVEEVRVAGRGETHDEVDGPEHQQQNTREHDPAVAAVLVLLALVAGGSPGAAHLRWSSATA